MIKIVFTPTENQENSQVVGRGDDLKLAIKNLFNNLSNEFGDEIYDFAPIYEGLIKIINGETEFNHSDFSCPEEQFKLEMIEIADLTGVE